MKTKIFVIIIAMLFGMTSLAYFGQTDVAKAGVAYSETVDIYEYKEDGGTISWTHTYDITAGVIESATLTIVADDVDGPMNEYDDGENDDVYFNGNYLGQLNQMPYYTDGGYEAGPGNSNPDEITTTTFTLDPSWISDTMPASVEIEALWDLEIETSTLNLEYQALTVVKTLESENFFVPFWTEVYFDLKITIENPDDGYDVDLSDVWVYDGIGAEHDLVIQDDGGGPYIFMLDGVPQLFDGDDDEFYGDTGDISWKQASEKAYQKMLEGNGKGCATNIWWYIGDLGESGSHYIEFSIMTKDWYTGNGKHWKQSYTSTCHHDINDGPVAMYKYDDETEYQFVWGDPLTVSVYNDEDPEADSDGDGYLDLDEVEVWGTDPCCPDSHPIFVSGFDEVRGAPIGIIETAYSTLNIEAELLDPDNFGFGGAVQCPIIFLDLVETIETESLVDGDGNLLCDIFFAGRTDVTLTNDEATELKAFLNAGGILYISGNSDDSGESYYPLFTELGWTDTFAGSQVAGGESSTPISTPITTGPFGTVGPLSSTSFRPFLYVSATCVSDVATDCLVAESAYGLGYISITADPLYFDVFSGDADNVNYFLNLFALAV